MSDEREIDYPTLTCPKCGDVARDFDGLGFIACTVCGYCTHPSRTGGICGICGDAEKDGAGSCGPEASLRAALEQLIAKWRSHEDDMIRAWEVHAEVTAFARGVAFRDCAKELAEVLSGASAAERSIAGAGAQTADGHDHTNSESQS